MYYFFYALRIAMLLDAGVGCQLAVYMTLCLCIVLYLVYAFLIAIYEFGYQFTFRYYGSGEASTILISIQGIASLI